MALAKICGINSPAAIDAAVSGGADFLGFVFFPPSPRSVTPEQAAALSARAPAAGRTGGPKRVGLFVKPDEAEIEAALRVLPLDVLQLYVDAPRAAALRARFGVPVWHAVGITSGADLPDAADGVDGLLLDAKPPPDGPLPGGNARPFDWSVLHAWRAPALWVLAGGLSPDNVAEAVRVTGAPVVDVSSGVERTRGEKDPAMILAFLREVRRGSTTPS